MNTQQAWIKKCFGAAAKHPTVQRQMGAEAEIKMPVTDGRGADIPGDFKLVEHAYFTMVSDHRQGYSNLEFVMKPFDQLHGTEPEALNELQVRLDAMKSLRDEIYAAHTLTPLTSLAGYGANLTNPHTPLSPAHNLAASARIDPLLPAYHMPAAREDGKVLVHYTIGFPLKYMYQAMGLVSTRGYDGATFRPRVHANGARSAADRVVAWCGGHLPAEDAEELKGAITLLYSQIAAFAEKTGRQRLARDAEYADGQIKNKAALLSRVNLSDIYAELPRHVQTLLRNQMEGVLDIIAGELERYANLDFNEPDVRHVPGLRETTLIDYAKSGMGGAAVDQQQVFGGMNVVGMDNTGLGGRKVPVEMRNMFSQFREWGEFVADARSLLVESRRIIQ